MRVLVIGVFVITFFPFHSFGQLGHEVFNASMLPPNEMTIGDYSIFSFSYNDSHSDNEDIIRLRDLFYDDGLYSSRNTFLHIEQPASFVDSIFTLFINQLYKLNIPIRIAENQKNYISPTYIGFNARDILRRTFEYEIRSVANGVRTLNYMLFPIIIINHRSGYSGAHNEYYFSTNVLVSVYLFHQGNLIYKASRHKRIVTDYEPRVGQQLKDYMKLLTDEDWNTLISELFEGFTTKESKKIRK